MRNRAVIKQSPSEPVPQPKTMFSVCLQILITFGGKLGQGAQNKQLGVDDYYY